MSLKTKIVGAIVALALASPPAFAVEGSDGMHYTSASEGFYASIRVRFQSGGDYADNGDPNPRLRNSTSRLGVQGTSEMSHGLEGFYRYETAFDVDDDSQGFGKTRIGHVGMRGGFGSLRVGSDWTDEYNFVFGNTDIANVGSGHFAYNARASRSIFYKSPDFNGLQVGARFGLDGGDDEGTSKADAQTAVNAAIGGNAGLLDNVVTPDSELDSWALSAKYAFSGFTLAGTYINIPDESYGLDRTVNSAGATTGAMVTDLEDLTSWALRGSYGQDNWGVAAWYGQNNRSDFSNIADDETVFSIAGNVSVGKSGVYVVHETKEDWLGRDDAATTFGVEYKFNSKAKTWIEYVGQDMESLDDDNDYVTIGLRHDF